ASLPRCETRGRGPSDQRAGLVPWPPSDGPVPAPGDEAAQPHPGLRFPDPLTHDFGLGLDFSEASAPGGLAVRRVEEPSATFGCPANWTAERCFLRRCYLNPTYRPASVGSAESIIPSGGALLCCQPSQPACLNDDSASGLNAVLAMTSPPAS